MRAARTEVKDHHDRLAAILPQRNFFALAIRQREVRRGGRLPAERPERRKTRARPEVRRARERRPPVGGQLQVARNRREPSERGRVEVHFRRERAQFVKRVEGFLEVAVFIREMGECGERLRLVLGGARGLLRELLGLCLVTRREVQPRQPLLRDAAGLAQLFLRGRELAFLQRQENAQFTHRRRQIVRVRRGENHRALVVTERQRRGFLRIGFSVFLWGRR